MQTRNYLIIGGSGGIGSSLVDILAKDGHRVYATYLNNKPEKEPDNVTYHLLDVLQPAYDLSWLPDQVHGIAYCPGSIVLKPFARITPEEIQTEMNLNLTGAFRLLQAVLPRLRKASGASVVLFSTVAVQTGFKFHALVSSVKGAIEGLTRALAAEFSPAIRVNCVAPSLTDTPLAAPLLNTEAKRQANADRHPMQRIGIPEDPARAAAFLLGEASGWMTGQILQVDGGISTLRI